MAKKIENEKGFLIIEMTVEEAINDCMFGCTGEIICDGCNKYTNNLEDIIYYIAVLNMAFCKECLDEFLNRQEHYEEDEDFEKENYNLIARMVALDIV